jgi:hypothetical protein
MTFANNIDLKINFSFKIMSSAFLNKIRDRFLAFQKGVME